MKPVRSNRSVYSDPDSFNQARKIKPKINANNENHKTNTSRPQDNTGTVTKYRML